MKRSWRSTLHAWLYLSPAFLIVAFFCLYPTFKAFDVSLYTEYDYYRDIVWDRGLGNFRLLLLDPTFGRALRNTIILVVTAVPVSILLSLGIAYALHRRRMFGEWLRTAFFLPLVTSILAVSMSWRWMFHTEYGIVNTALQAIGAEPVGWLTSPKWALPSLIVFAVWHSLGLNILLLLVGMQAIPPQYDEAARMEGASVWQRLTHITLPLLSPVFYYVLLGAILRACLTFDEVYALFGGSRAGPMDRALTVSYYIFRKFYTEADYGIASAAACVLMILLSAISLLLIYRYVRISSLLQEGKL